jgi:hypothetical protein
VSVLRLTIAFKSRSRTLDTIYSFDPTIDLETFIPSSYVDTLGAD